MPHPDDFPGHIPMANNALGFNPFLLGSGLGGEQDKLTHLLHLLADGLHPAAGGVVEEIDVHNV